MRILPAILLAAALVAGCIPVASAESPEPVRAEPAAEAERSSLDALFSDLKRERNERAARRLSERIRAEWLRSGSATVDLMMGWSDEAMKARKFDVALDFLDQVVTLRPAFAEGWNRRATVHFMMRDYAKAMSDIDRTLRLEPRHFGALGGMAQIMKATGRSELALDAYRRVLEVYPMLRSAQAEVARISDELAGDPA